MILVTGAAGKTGRAIIRALKGAGQEVRAFVGTSVSLDIAGNLGADEAVIGDLRDIGVLRSAAAGVSAIYFIAPNVHADELMMGRNVIEAARSVGYARLVIHSVLHPATEKMPHHWQKLRVEEAVYESGLPYTILQPAPYMQNLLAQWQTMTRESVLRQPYPVVTRLSLVDVHDVAEVALHVLIGRGHLNATYELAGTDPLSQTEVATIVSERLSQKITAKAVRPADWDRSAREAGWGEYARSTLLSMFDYYAKHGLSGNPNVLRWLLGREPTSLAGFIDRTLRERNPNLH
jgi:uncharacterized protein YbjT (DUF2867 family)